MASITGPGFIALQTRDLRHSRAFYVEQLGLEPLATYMASAKVMLERSLHASANSPRTWVTCSGTCQL